MSKGSSAPAFTPGPWVIETTENPHLGGAHWRQVRAGEHGQVIGEVFHDLGDPDPGLTDEDAAANANLIAAAPELYEALVAQEDAAALAAAISEATPDGERVAEEAMRQADQMFARAEKLRRGALAKARGEQ